MNPPHLESRRAPADNKKRKADLATASGPAFYVYKQVNSKSISSTDREVEQLSWVCLINQFPECYHDNCANDIDHSLATGDSHSFVSRSN